MILQDCKSFQDDWKLSLYIKSEDLTDVHNIKLCPYSFWHHSCYSYLSALFVYRKYPLQTIDACTFLINTFTDYYPIFMDVKKNQEFVEHIIHVIRDSRSYIRIYDLLLILSRRNLLTQSFGNFFLQEAVHNIDLYLPYVNTEHLLILGMLIDLKCDLYLLARWIYILQLNDNIQLFNFPEFLIKELYNKFNKTYDQDIETM